MSDKKGLGSTVLGWFVVKDELKPQSADELIAKYSSDTLPPPPPEAKFQGELPKAAGGQVDFPGVFRAAGINEEEQGRVEKAASLLKTLPAETPKDVKRQIVETSLKTFGYPVEQIIEAAAQEVQSLEMYIQAGQKETQSLLAQSQQRIEQLTTEIANVKKVMEDQVAAQYALTQTCNQHKLAVQEVLEFFGQEAVARVVKESAKLHEPAPQQK